MAELDSPVPATDAAFQQTVPSVPSRETTIPASLRQGGPVLVIGGEATFENFGLFATLRKPGSAITVFTGSTEWPQDQFNRASTWFQDHGVTRIHHLGAHTSEADGVDMILDTGGVFLDGGNQLQGLALLKERGWLAPLKQAHEQGIPEGGSSAGAMILGGPVMAYRRRIVEAGGVLDISLDTHRQRGRDKRQDDLVKVTGASSLLLPEGGGVVYSQGEIIVFGDNQVRFAFVHEGEVHAVLLQPQQREHIDELPRNVIFSRFTHQADLAA